MADVTYEFPMWIMKTLMATIIAFVCVMLVANAVNKELNTRELQSDLLLSRILYSPDSIWYSAAGVTYPGVVDISKFDQNRLNANFIYRDNYGGANLTLKYGSEQHTILIENSTYQLYRKQFDEGLSKGGVVDAHVYPVVVKTANGEVNGVLTIEIAMPEKA